MSKFTFDWFGIVWWPLAIWLGCSGRVDWWVIVLVASSHISVKQTFGRR
jgi:hypothetical protein